MYLIKRCISEVNAKFSNKTEYEGDPQLGLARRVSESLKFWQNKNPIPLNYEQVYHNYDWKHLTIAKLSQAPV